ncbi:MAG TPA: hypothetical protein VM487_16625 [Phycisphaerae bacterium]|nr:hypothetical protein [Phycisphaerae bacterium]
MKPGTTEQLQRKRKRLVILAVGIGLLLLAVAVAMPWANPLSRGRFPKVGEVEEELGVWALAEQAGVLRGRPLTEIRFTGDASQQVSCCSLWRDKTGRIVAFSACYWSYPDALEYTETVEDLAARIAWRKRNLLGSDITASIAVGDFMRKWVDCPAFATIADRPFESANGTQGRRGTAQHRGFDIEVEVSRRSVVGQGDPPPKGILVIVKGRDW